MAQHEVEIRITKDGQVRVHVKGVKGKACQEYAKWLTELIGRVKQQQWTSEHYEPEVQARAALYP